MMRSVPVQTGRGRLLPDWRLPPHSQKRCSVTSLTTGDNGTDVTRPAALHAVGPLTGFALRQQSPIRAP